MSHNKSISWLLMLKSSPLSHDYFVKKIPVVNRYIYVYMCVWSCVYIYMYICIHKNTYVCVCFNFQCCMYEKPKSSWGHADDLHDTTVISVLNARPVLTLMCAVHTCVSYIWYFGLTVCLSSFWLFF